MNKLIISIGLLGLSTTLLTGCVEEQAQNLVDSLTGNTGVTVFSTTGNYVSLDGSYDTGCYNDGTNGRQETLTIVTDSVSGVTGVTYNSVTWAADPTCVNGMSSSAMTGLLLDVDDSVIKGWIDATGLLASPPASAAGPALLASQGYTNLALTVVTGGADFGLGSGDLGTFSFIADDSDVAGSGLVLYRLIKRSGSAGSDALTVPFNTVP